MGGAIDDEDGDCNVLECKTVGYQKIEYQMVSFHQEEVRGGQLG